MTSEVMMLLCVEAFRRILTALELFTAAEDLLAFAPDFPFPSAAFLLKNELPLLSRPPLLLVLPGPRLLLVLLLLLLRPLVPPVFLLLSLVSFVSSARFFDDDEGEDKTNGFSTTSVVVAPEVVLEVVFEVVLEVEAPAIMGLSDFEEYPLLRLLSAPSSLLSLIVFPDTSHIFATISFSNFSAAAADSEGDLPLTVDAIC
jgi:hypothetical protein